MKPNIDLSEEQRGFVALILNVVLSDEYILYTKTRNYHWNVVGHQFHSLHKFFEEQYEQLDEIIDDVAERVRTIGGWSLGTLSEFLKHTRLKEQPAHHPSDMTMLAELLEDHETMVRHLRIDLEICANKYQDMGTNDFLTGLMEKHEKMAWMLRSFFEDK